MNAQRFINILKHKTNLNEYKINLIEDEKITELVDLYDNTVIKEKITIIRCVFNEELVIENWTFENFVEFEDCTFKKGIRIHNGTFCKTLDFKWITVLGKLQITGGQFEKVSISFRNTKSTWITGGNFEELHIGDWLGDKHLEELIIINKRDLIGNIKVVGHTINKIYINGGNSQRNLLFRDIKCNHFIIKDLANSENLKLHGLVPISSGNSYFEIYNSTLFKAQFYKISFNKFDEVILVDTFINEVSILNSTWGDSNFRAISVSEDIPEIKERNTISLEEIKQLKENFRQLKFVYEKQGDKINETFFYNLEMNSYNSLLSWSSPFQEIFWQKTILLLSRTLTSYGSSFLRPLLGLLLSTLLILLILISLYNYQNLEIVLPNKNDSTAFQIAIGEFFKLLNPLRKMDESLQGWAVMWDLISRILNSYFIFALIRSSRRFLR